MDSNELSAVGHWLYFDDEPYLSSPRLSIGFIHVTASNA